MIEPQVLPMTVHVEPLSPEAFAPFGEVLLPPRKTGERSAYTHWLGSERRGMAPRLHLNLVAPSTLPVSIARLECHPYTAQIFLPLDVARYLVVVAPSGPSGAPLYLDAQAFLTPGTLGIVYAPGTWHAGMTVLDRQGSFSVLMWRNESEEDEEFFSLPAPLRVER